MSEILKNVMPPPWIKYPALSEFSLGWRMGAAEDYKFKFWQWFERLDEAAQRAYARAFPYPCFWHYGGWDELDETSENERVKCAHGGDECCSELQNLEFSERGGLGDDLTDDIDDFYREGLPFWRRDGAAKYDKTSLINSSEAHKFLFFYKPDAAADESCLGQWQSSPFAVDADEYLCAEQFMMASKAQIFGDEQMRARIMQSRDAKQMKALGRQVRGFAERLWGEVRYSVVLSGNYYKFTQNPAMMRFLLATGDKILVEAGPLDKIWGIGLGRQSENASRPSAWRGRNLLGFALMEVRDELRRLYKNYDLIDKKFLRD